MATETTDTNVPTRLSFFRRLWWLFEILNVRLRFIFLMVIVGFVVGYWENIMNHVDRWRRPDHAPSMVAAQEIEYYCAMHPNIIRSEPGNCPICGMPLVKRAKTAHATLPAGVLARQQLTPLKVQMGRITTSPVEYRLLAREVRTVGIVGYDETRRRNIAARIRGRIDRLMVNYVGQYVKEGDPLIWIYSPALLTAQDELLLAQRRGGSELKAANTPDSFSDSLIDASRQRLLLWGVTQRQIDEIIQRGTADTHLIVYAPISGFVTEKNVLEGHYVAEGDDLYTIADLNDVWMEAKIFEDEIAGISIGTAVQVISTSHPNETFAGKITFIAYVVDPATRTVSARVEIANPDLKLKPGMNAHAVIRTPLGQVSESSSAQMDSPQTISEDSNQLDTSGLARALLLLMGAYCDDRSDDPAVAEVVTQAQKLALLAPRPLNEQANAIAQAAMQLKGKDLEAQRGMLKQFNEKVIQFLRNTPPPELKLFVLHCPMVEADWLQDTETVANPFMGKRMPKCGEVTGTISASNVLESERFVTGYYCPVYPDRLFDKPELCPVDRFPLKLAKVEKTLAVPVSAVINTGTRTVVYRETEPGTFDMLEVTIGKRAGEYYPVLSGLRPGDHVATAGAFLVDAENRLNPAAGAQFFGASSSLQGGQSNSEHPH